MSLRETAPRKTKAQSDPVPILGVYLGVTHHYFNLERFPDMPQLVQYAAQEATDLRKEADALIAKADAYEDMCIRWKCFRDEEERKKTAKRGE